MREKTLTNITVITPTARHTLHANEGPLGFGSSKPAIPSPYFIKVEFGQACVCPLLSMTEVLIPRPPLEP